MRPLVSSVWLVGGGEGENATRITVGFFIFKYIFRLFSYCCSRSCVKGECPTSCPPLAPHPAAAAAPGMLAVLFCTPVRAPEGSRLPEHLWLPSTEGHGGPVSQTLPLGELLVFKKTQCC